MTTRKFEDYRGREHEFKDKNIMDAFEEVDKLEESIRDKYFDDDQEFAEGTRLAKKLKGQLRRIDKDLCNLEELKEEGMVVGDD